jgi:hypothetical protein
MNENKIDPLEIQFHLVHDCVRACIYADFIARNKPKGAAWLSICDMLYSEAVISWNAIFGTNSQDSHWKNMIKKLPIPNNSNIKPFCKDMILDYLKTDAVEWEKYHASMVDFRNKRLAHFDFKVVREEFPNFTWAMNSAYLYREWLISLLLEYRKTGKDIAVTETSGEAMVALFKSQISEICK